MNSVLLTIGGVLAAVFAVAADAQSTHVLPRGAATTEGDSSNGFPWGRGPAASLQMQTIYDSSHFTSVNIGYPIQITRLRWRCNGGVGCPGGSYSQATVDMATAAVDAMNPSTSFAANMGPDRTQVYSGPVTQQAVAVATPGRWFVDIACNPPFVYDPGSGSDLVIFCDIPPGAGAAAAAPQIDVKSTNSLASRVHNSTAYGSGQGTVNTSHGVVVELTWAPAPNAALATAFGTPCYDRSSSFYEVFQPNTFDLSNTALQMVSTGVGYVVLPSTPNWFVPQAANLNLGDERVSPAQALPFTFSYPGGSTNSLYVSSNGFIWTSPNTDPGCCAGAGPQLLAGATRFCPLWLDLQTLSGSVHFDIDPSGSVAYVTWQSVTEYGTANPSSVQAAFSSAGQVEYRWQGCTITNHACLVGWSIGGGAHYTPPIDLSARMPFTTGPENGLTLQAAPRPLLGNTVVLTTSYVPGLTTIGATIFGLTRFNPGIDLTALGMPGCFRYVSLDASVVFVPSGTIASLPLTVPNAPHLTGAHFYCQSATFTPGVNALGMLASNGVDLLLGTR